MVICPKCGKENVDDAVFCNSCGNPLSPKSLSEQPSNLSPAIQDQKPKMSDDKITVIAVLGILAGVMGFFLSRLFGIIGIACGAYILTKTSKSSQRQLGWIAIVIGVIIILL